MEGPQSVATSGPLYKASAMETIDRASARLRIPDPVPYLPPLPMRVQELMVGRQDSTSESDTDASSAVTAWEVRVRSHPLTRDLCLTGRGDIANIREAEIESYGGFGERNWNRDQESA